MSKSLGNVVNPLEIVDNYGVDPLRYYLMRDMVLGQDASYSFKSFVKRYNSDLANDFGNLVNRVTMLIRKHFNGVIPESGNYCETDLELIALAKTTPQKVEKSIQEMRIHDALEYTIALFRKMNVYLECKAPWKTVKTDNKNGGVTATTLALSADILRIGTQLLNPTMPNKTKSILNILGAKNSISDTEIGQLRAGTILGEGKSPFPRIIL